MGWHVERMTTGEQVLGGTLLFFLQIKQQRQQQQQHYLGPPEKNVERWGKTVPVGPQLDLPLSVSRHPGQVKVLSQPLSVRTASASCLLPATPVLQESGFPAGEAHGLTPASPPDPQEVRLALRR